MPPAAILSSSTKSLPKRSAIFLHLRDSCPFKDLSSESPHPLRLNEPPAPRRWRPVDGVNIVSAVYNLAPEARSKSSTSDGPVKIGLKSRENRQSFVPDA